MGIAALHPSCTFKAAGSRDILLLLASALGLSLRDRNALLEAGGFARQYGERDLSAPEVADASTTQVPCAMPLVTALRSGKVVRVGGVDGKICDTTAPVSAIACASDAFSFGYMWSKP